MINWHSIDTVLLDMDGTLLDLHFDNFFWRTHLPKRYAQTHGVDETSATQQILGHIGTREGTLKWYCLEHWSELLQMDVAGLKIEVRDKIRVRPFAVEFLRRLRTLNKKRVLITNAHPQSLRIKLEVTAIDRCLDMIISSHEFREPKETQEFWRQLHRRESFDRERTLFIDDTVRILDSAKQFGVQHLLCIKQPDSRGELREIEGYPAIEHFDEIMPSLTDIRTSG